MSDHAQPCAIDKLVGAQMIKCHRQNSDELDQVVRIESRAILVRSVKKKQKTGLGWHAILSPRLFKAVQNEQPQCAGKIPRPLLVNLGNQLVH